MFLSTGRQGLAHFAALGLWFLVRTVDPPDPPLPARTELLTARGPFTVDDERELLRQHRIDVLVTKDSGGAMTAAKLTADDFFHHCRPLDHREKRPSRADPSPPSGAREEQPNAGDDRRSPAPLGQRRETTRGDWSNLTSGPSGPTVSDPRSALSLFKWRRKPPSAFPLLRKRISAETFSFFWFYLKTDLTKL